VRDDDGFALCPCQQFKRHHRQLRLLRSRLGRIIRDIRRKITGRPELEADFEAPMRAVRRSDRTAAPACFAE